MGGPARMCTQMILLICGSRCLSVKQLVSQSEKVHHVVSSFNDTIG